MIWKLFKPKPIAIITYNPIITESNTGLAIVEQTKALLGKDYHVIIQFSLLSEGMKIEIIK